MPGYRKAADLPKVIPVFPLDGALLLPGARLPLNIFEPRYLNMIDDAMAGDRVIGMIQTRHGGDRSRPRLAGVGCVGRITSYAETSDGRYLITLTGVCRFQAGEELNLGKVNITLTDQNQVTTTIGQVPDAASCPGDRPAWYYDNPAAPVHMVLCPTACTQVSGATAGSRVNVVVGCDDTVIIPVF